MGLFSSLESMVDAATEVAKTPINIVEDVVDGGEYDEKSGKRKSRTAEGLKKSVKDTGNSVKKLFDW